MQAAQAKVSAVLATGVVCFALGVGAGILGMAFFGEPGYPRATAQAVPADMPGGGMGKAGGGPGAPGGPGGAGKAGGFRGPSPKNQLVSLVDKLDLLTQKPLSISLSADQKKQVAERLKGLEALETLADEDAKTRLDALLETLKDHKETLEAAGYRWPGQPFSRPANVPNPFKDEKNGKALSALQQRVAPPSK